MKRDLLRRVVNPKLNLKLMIHVPKMKLICTLYGIPWCLLISNTPSPKKTGLLITDHCFWPIAVLIPEAVKMSVARSVVLRKPVHQRLVMPLIRNYIFISYSCIAWLKLNHMYMNKYERLSSIRFGPTQVVLDHLDLCPAALFNPRLIQKCHRQQIQPALNLEAWKGPSSHLRHEVTLYRKNQQTVS